jgi:hypothetical protein
MLNVRGISPWLGAAALILLLGASQAKAASSVTVRVEGLNSTLLTPTVVATGGEPVVKDGNPQDSCLGTSALGALQVATGGNWGGPWSAKYLQYSIGSIDGESHEFGSGYYWSFWLNHHEAEVGACEASPESGQEVLFFPCPETSACGAPLGLQAPSTSEPGAPFTVTVVRYAANGSSSPVEGGTVTGGSSAQMTDHAGQATISFASPGIAMVRAEAPEAIRTDAAVCVHAGNDGTCGTTAPASAPTSIPVPPPAPYKGPFAVVAQVSGVTEGRVYGRGQAPRILAGTVISQVAVTSVTLALRREYRGRCYTYEGNRERFVRSRCWKDSAFQVAQGGRFSYLLPTRLQPGRYVLDVQGTDAAGNQVALARGTSRVVFYVR